MRLLTLQLLQLLAVPTFALRYAIHHTSQAKDTIQANNDVANQHPFHLPVMPPTEDSSSSDQQPVQGNIMLSDVMGRDRSMNLFAGFTRDIATISQRFDSSSQNSTVLAPLNSAIDALPRKPWEDSADYDALGANAYEGDDGRNRAEKNMQKFVEAHVLPASPWAEGQKVKSLLGDGDREVWWEMKNGKMVVMPDEIEVSSIASRVGNGEIWIIKGVRNYA